jgi:hypothetical protein
MTTMPTTPTSSKERLTKEESEFDEFSGILLSSESSSKSTPTKSITEEIPPVEGLQAAKAEEIQSDEAVQASEITKCYDAAKSSYEKLAKFAFKHDPMNPRNWCSEIVNHPTFLGLQARHHFLRVLKYNTIAGPLFIFAEHMEPVMTDAIWRLSGKSDIYLGLSPAGAVLETVEALLSPESPPPVWPHIITSDKLFAGGNMMGVVQYNDSQTIIIPSHVFENMIQQFPNLTGYLGTINFNRYSASELQQMEIEEWKQHAMSRIELLENITLSNSQSQTLQRRTNRVKHVNVTDILRKHENDLRDIREKIGPLHESVVRLGLQSTRGSEWVKSKTISGLYDMFSFVAGGLNVTPSQRKKGETNLYTSLMSGFQSWNYNPNDVKLADIDFDAVT